jgi:hypothetical protein
MVMVIQLYEGSSHQPAEMTSLATLVDGVGVEEVDSMVKESLF